MSDVPTEAAPASESAQTAQELELLRGLIAKQDQARAVQRAEEEAAERQRQLQIDTLRAEADHWRAEASRARTVQAVPVPSAPRAPAARPANVVRTPRAKATAMITGATVDRAAIGIMQYGAVALLLVGFLGSVVAFNTGWPLRSGWAPLIAAWPHPWEGLNPWAAVAGIGLQIWLTLVEWHKRHQKKSLLYVSHLGIDAGLTWGGYYPILGPFFALGLLKLGVPSPWNVWIAVGIVAVLAVIVAKVPEELLVEG